MNQTQAITALRRLGWRVRTTGEYVQAVKFFQDAWMLGPQLKTDGVVGNKTSAALLQSIAGLTNGTGTASPHFSFHEFACHCGGRYNSCPRIWVKRQLLESLEHLRGNTPMSIISGCRCNEYNKKVHGASSSQHLYGAAADITPRVTHTAMRSKRLFAGIGYNHKTGLVAHVDRRDVSGNNATRSNTANPAVWVYSR